MRKKSLVLFLCVMLLTVILLPQTVSANSPPPPAFCTVELVNPSPEAYYVDLLVPLSKNQPDYVQQPQLPEAFENTAPILLFEEQGYMSYTYHYANSSSQNVVGENSITFFEGSISHYGIFKDKSIKLAVLDKKGNILQISEPFVLTETYFAANPTGTIIYNCLTGQINVEQEIDSSKAHIQSIFFLLVSVLCEVLVACIFRLKLLTVAIVNVFSQIIMRVLFHFMYGTLIVSYVWLVVILEIIVYTAEYFVFCGVMRHEKKSKILWYTAIANTCSLVVGLLLFNPEVLQFF